ncbi:hypothetical protein [Neisseria gonorrhoeae]|uniref:hypothetical protein n=1 Tax=Neisseria gonorrhoeae TaxID=485 RepID=UPI00223EB48B|nr:hypothetical protein [Neisseria gonorrhoeae]UYP52484.1 hypothetical protein ND436_002885 [Neisseria gonorrhoeae]
MSFHPETAYTGGGEQSRTTKPRRNQIPAKLETAETRRMTEKQAEGHIKSIIR